MEEEQSENMEFLENEQLLWRHVVQIAKRKGDCILTNIRLIYQPHDAPAEIKSWTWPNITNVLFPKNDSATAFRVKTMLQGEEEVIIQIVDSGQGVDKKVAEYIKAKSIITDIREGKTVQMDNITIFTVSVVKKENFAVPTSGNKMGTASSSSGGASAKQQAIIHEIRKKIIDVNESIRNQYKQLVEGNILNEEDFWKSYQYLIDDSLAKSLSSSKQGIPNVVWTEIVQDVNGKRKINLSADNRELIFRLYPVVRKTYENEVSTSRMAEKDFWHKFFQSELFNNGGTPDPQRAANAPLVSIFEKNKSSTKDIIEQLTDEAKAKNKFTDRHINSEVDLTAMLGDNGILPTLDGEDQILPDNPDLVKQYGQVIRRFNQESIFVMTKDKKAGSKTSAATKTTTDNHNDKTDDYQEQIETQPVKYVKVNLSKIHNVTKPALKREVSKQEHTEVFRIGYKRKLVPAELMKDIEDEGVLVAKEENGNGIQVKLLNERSRRLWKEEQLHLSKLENTHLNADATRKDALPESMQQVYIIH